MFNLESTSKEVLGVIAGIISFGAFILYFVSIHRKRTTPSISSWWIWVISSALIASSYDASGARNAIWVPWGDTIGTVAIAIVALKKGAINWKKNSIDRYCIAGASSSIILWWMFDAPSIALLINIIIDACGVAPTVKKIYNRPDQENQSAWILIVLADIINLFSVENFNFSIIVLPIYMVVANTTIAILVCARPMSIRMKTLS